MPRLQERLYMALMVIGVLAASFIGGAVHWLESRW